MPPCSAPGERLQAKLGGGDKSGLAEGVTGLKNGPARTGVRELTYRLVFIASGTQVRGARSGCMRGVPCVVMPDLLKRSTNGVVTASMLPSQ